MIHLHDRAALAAHCRAARVDPQHGERLARLVLREGLAVEAALAKLRAPVPASWSDALARDVLTLERRVDSAADGATKLLLRAPSGAPLESVLLRVASGRRALCLSIQSRCPVGCRFCASGSLGRVESLALEELLDQVVQARRLLAAEGGALRNLVFMGMGEPLLEEALLFAALERLVDPRGFGFGPSRVTVSTVGLPEGMRRLAARFPGVRQALSLHAARPEVRERLIPVARRHGLDELRDALREVGERSGGRVLVEVLLLDGVNDGPEDEAALAAWLEGLPARLNLIPYNPPGALPQDGTLDPTLRPSPRERCEAWAAAFRARGVETTLRRSLGADVAAACGQLAARRR